MSEYRIIRIDLEAASLGPGDVNADHERRVAIADLLESNHFRPEAEGQGPYALRLAIEDDRLVFDVRQEDETPVHAFVFALGPLRRIIKDYFLICESYYEAIRTSTPSQIEAIDMGRRGMHNEGSQTLMDRLSGKIDMDFDTARRLFTLVCVLHWRG